MKVRMLFVLSRDDDGGEWMIHEACMDNDATHLVDDEDREGLITAGTAVVRFLAGGVFTAAESEEIRQHVAEAAPEIRAQAEKSVAWRRYTTANPL